MQNWTGESVRNSQTGGMESKKRQKRGKSQAQPGKEAIRLYAFEVQQRALLWELTGCQIPAWRSSSRHFAVRSHGCRGNELRSVGRNSSPVPFLADQAM